MNLQALSGNLVSDPELVEIKERNTHVVNLRIAINNFRKKDNETVNAPVYVDLEAWDSAALYIARRFKKGHLIIAETEIRQNQWEDADGNKKNRTKYRITRFEGPYVKVREDEGA